MFAFLDEDNVSKTLSKAFCLSFLLKLLLIVIHSVDLRPTNVLVIRSENQLLKIIGSLH